MTSAGKRLRAAVGMRKKETGVQGRREMGGKWGGVRGPSCSVLGESTVGPWPGIP